MTNELSQRCINEVELPNEDFDVVELITYYLIKEINKPRKAKPRPFYPSSFGNRCKRSLYLHRTGAKSEEKTSIKNKLLFMAGDANHEALQDLLKNHKGIKIEESVKIPSLDISGRVDGVFTSEDWVLEIKSVGDATFRSLVKAKQDHIYQTHCYMWGFDIPRGQILYVNRNDGTLRKFDVKFSNEVWSEIVELVAEVDGHVEREEPPPYEPIDYICSGCKFFEISCDPPIKKKKHGK